MEITFLTCRLTTTSYGSLWLTCLAQVGVVFAIPLYAQYPVQIDLKGGKAYGIDIIVRLTFASH